MKYGARNRIQARVKSVKKGDVMSLVKFDVTIPHEMSSVLTTESVEDIRLAPGDDIELVIKAIHVLPVKD
ncbi:MAG: TOBE domain-containing protein [Desulfobacteraceae bacterium]|jgi:molybdate transport system regulatory protein|nr:TOBE domain-containing protein [Desulfobacteraceae bacterium]